MVASPSLLLPTYLADIFSPEAVVIGLQHSSKKDVIAELVNRLVKTDRIAADAERVLIETILAPETIGSTALGNGVAFPHCRSSVTETFVGAVGIDTEGVSFDAVDNEPVHVVFLIVGPLTRRAQLFDVLARITSISRNRAVRLQLTGSRSADRAIRVLREWDPPGNNAEESDGCERSPTGQRSHCITLLDAGNLAVGAKPMNFKKGDHLILTTRGMRIPVEAVSDAYKGTVQIKNKGAISTAAISDLEIADAVAVAATESDQLKVGQRTPHCPTCEELGRVLKSWENQPFASSD